MIIENLRFVNPGRVDWGNTYRKMELSMGRNFAPRMDENERHMGFDVSPNGVVSLEGRPADELARKASIVTPDNGHLVIQAMLDSADKTLNAPTPTSKPPGYQS